MKIQYFLFLIVLSTCNKPPLSHFGDKELSGQTPTSDMVFVAGKGKVPSFYVGVSEEPNVNYVAYLHWLRRVYLDYPEEAKQAEIKVKTLGEVHRFNDPLLTYHMEHPAFAYYPVVGATWYQANKYLQWKTDRVNEAILIKNKILEVDYDQINEANFNTEAYVYGQGDGLRLGKNQLKDERMRKGGTRFPVWQDGIILPHYRLPTEAEWELLRDENKSSDFHSQYPYGKNYPILRWARGHFRGSGSQYEASAMQDYDYHWKKGVIPNPSDYPNYGQGIQGPYLSKNNKLPSNIAGNVREWLLDIYEEEPQNDWESYAEYFWQNEFETRIDSLQFIYDQDGIIDLKDSLGEFPFKIYGTNSDGSPFLVVPPIANGSYRRFMRMKYLEVPLAKYDSWNTNDFETFYKKTKPFIKQAYYDFYFPTAHLQGYNWQYRLPKEPLQNVQMKLKYSQFGYNVPKYGYCRVWNVMNLNMDSIDARAKNWIKEFWDVEVKNGLSYFRLGDGQLVYHNDTLGDYTKSWVEEYKAVKTYTNARRVIRGGTWQSPGFNRREPMSPDSAAMDVGFRCVMPYISTPV